MLLYISGSFPDNQEGIAAGAKVLLDAMVEVSQKDHLILLTTNTPIISNNIDKNTEVKYYLMEDWKVRPANVKRIYEILDKNDIRVIHMEYPGDLYGKTFLASFLPLFVKFYNKRNKKQIQFNVRLHEFTRARFLRKIAILPILWFADNIYVPALKDREVMKKFAGNKVKKTTIGTNIEVASNELLVTEKKTISYFGSVYPGKGIERMLSIWKKIHEQDQDNKYCFKIIGDVGIEPDNHFCDFHKQVLQWIEKYDLKDVVEITGYLSDQEVSEQIQKTSVATLPYEDGLTLRRGSFLAYLSHGVPVVTSEGDEESRELFDTCKGVSMVDSDQKFVDAVLKYGSSTEEELEEINRENISLSEYFRWDKIAENYLKDYQVI